MLAHSRKGSGAELLFLHGWGCDKDFFKTADNLKGFTVTRLDFYGFGETPAPTFPIDLDYYVDAVEEIMRFYNMEDVIVVGHSFGGRVAIRLAQNSRVSGLILVDSAGLKPKRKLSYYFKVGIYKTAKFFHIHTKFTKNLGSEDYKKLTGSMKRTFINVVNEDLTKQTKTITVPTMLIWGEKDLETPLEMLHRMEKNIKNSTTVLFEGCGHFCFLENPKRFYSLVSEFAKSVTQN